MDGNKAINDARKEERKPAISRAVRQKKEWRGEWKGRKERRQGGRNGDVGQRRYRRSRGEGAEQKRHVRTVHANGGGGNHIHMQRTYHQRRWVKEESEGAP